MKVEVPDIGDFDEVPVIEILVSEGDEVSEEDPLVTLESDKATMDVPSPAAGTVGKILVSVGDKVSQGTPILELDTAGDEPGTDEKPDVDAEEQADDKTDDEAERKTDDEAAASTEPAGGGSGEPRGDGGRREQPGRRPPEPEADRHAQVLVVGSGPGGYSAAFRAADLGLEVVLVERFERLGGVCLNVGCIPSKALLHAARVLAEAEEAESFGIAFGEPQIDLDRLRGWKDEVVGKLTGGLGGLARRRKVEVVRGTAAFTSPTTVDVDGTSVSFEHCIVAAGSRSVMLPGLPDDPRVIDSTGALELQDVPERLLVVGGGIIGLEMATVFDALGSRVTVVELTDDLIPGCDRDLVEPLRKRIEGRYEAILLGTRLNGVEARDDGLHASFEGADEAVFDRVLVAVGRRPNGDRLDCERAGLHVDDRGFIPVDERLRTNVEHIHAIGDIVGGPMLAHKASHEGKVAAEAIAGRPVAFDAQAIPSVAYTDPEIAWMGLTETQAEQDGTDYEKAVFPWQAAGRALSLDRPEGFTKLLIDPESRRVLGAGMVGPNAGELVAETVLALELGADAEDVGLTIHPHPTLSETVGLAAEVAEGTVTDIYAPKRSKRG